MTNVTRYPGHGAVALGFLGMMIATSAVSKIRCEELGEVMLDSD